MLSFIPLRARPTLCNYATQQVRKHPLRFPTHVGQDDWDAQRARSYADADAIFMCFSIISPPSFEHIKTKVFSRNLFLGGRGCNRMQWVAEWRRNKPDTPVVLIGTKKDMRTDPELMRRLGERGLAPISTAQGTPRSRSDFYTSPMGQLLLLCLLLSFHQSIRQGTCKGDRRC